MNDRSDDSFSRAIGRAYRMRPMTDALPPGLHIVATPIGNLGDLSAARRRHASARRPILAEDTRVTAKLLAHIGAKVPMSRYDDHSSEAERRSDRRAPRRGGDRAGQRRRNPADLRPRLQARPRRARRGPCGRDRPGPVRRDRRADARRACRPTASCSSASCRPRPRRGPTRSPRSRRPRDAGLLRERAAARRHACARSPSSSAPRDAAVARELTKLHEECVTGTLAELAERYADVVAQGRDRDRRRPAGRGRGGQRRRARSPRSTTRWHACRRRAPRPRSPSSSTCPRKRAYARALELSRE